MCQMIDFYYMTEQLQTHYLDKYKDVQSQVH